jgi:ubiquinone/menaquinone biosynthesis C-methylase UbiE
MANAHKNTVEGFGDEWERYDQTALSQDELKLLFERYFGIFPWERLNSSSVGFDMGCGSGRWAQLVAPRVGRLICIDPSSAINVAKANLDNFDNCEFIQGGVGGRVLDEASMDFGYSLGVLHHVPNTLEAIKECASFLKKGSPFLLYLYYKFDNRSKWFVLIWKCSEIIRSFVSKLPHSLRYIVSVAIATLVYFPLAKMAKLLELAGLRSSLIEAMPLASYRDLSFYTMRTDALDRFGTQLEQRFTKAEITAMLTAAGFENIQFSDNTPYWCAVAIKK